MNNNGKEKKRQAGRFMDKKRRSKMEGININMAKEKEIEKALERLEDIEAE